MKQIQKKTHLNKRCKGFTEDLPLVLFGTGFPSKAVDVTGEEGVSVVRDAHPIAMPYLNWRMSVRMCLCVHGMCGACAVITRITV